MSLTSYRAAPSRAKQVSRPAEGDVYEWVFRISAHAPASMPGDDLLFRGLSHSTIGAVRFHGRVRDGIGWVTDAMVTKQ